MKIVHVLAAFLVAVSVDILPAAAVSNEEQRTLADLQQQLRRSIDRQNFLNIETKPTNDKRLRWSGCGPNAKSEYLSFRELTDRLRALSKGRSIKVNPNTIGLIDTTVVETKGWQPDSRYIGWEDGKGNVYFDFLVEHEGTRWEGVYICERKNTEFGYGGDDFTGDVAADAEVSDGSAKPAFAVLVKRALARRDFAALKQYVAEGATVMVGYCGPGDTSPIDLEIEELNARLRKNSNAKKVRLLGSPYSNVDLAEGRAYIQTEGWQDKERYYRFIFERDSTTKRWVWTAMCSANHLDDAKR